MSELTELAELEKDGGKSFNISRYGSLILALVNTLVSNIDPLEAALLQVQHGPAEYHLDQRHLRPNACRSVSEKRVRQADHGRGEQAGRGHDRALGLDEAEDAPDAGQVPDYHWHATRCAE